jgi:hypothetical protein
MTYVRVIFKTELSFGHAEIPTLLIVFVCLFQADEISFDIPVHLGILRYLEEHVLTCAPVHFLFDHRVRYFLPGAHMDLFFHRIVTITV